ncbi:YciI family protein [Gaopeijia maritima]|uniref:YciI family protein n=1 Tax=Gaopeijia maritima TaxID=3119007 RepID=A0ABU9E864_9BACT
MRFMMLVIPKGYESADPGTVPDDPEAVARMMEYNEALQKAGVLLALDGLHPPSMGFRVSYSGGTPTVVDGPFAEVKEVVGGYWMIEVASREEAVEWAKKAPMADDEIIEVRQVQSFDDFPEEVQDAIGDFDMGDKEIGR